VIRILFLGEIVGIPTVKELRKNLKKIITDNNIDLVIANADGASDGYGLLADTAYQIHSSGVDIITSGDFIFNKKDIKDFLAKANFILRAYNLPKDSAGRGYLIYNAKNDSKIAVVNLLGRTNFNKIFPNDPFALIDIVLEKLHDITPNIIVDFHGGTTSEIQAMQWHLAGDVSLVAGSHLRVLTTDNRIIKEKTAVITGLGFCGGLNSIGGLSPETEIKKIKSGQFAYSKIANENIIFQGILTEIDETNGKSLSINLFQHKISNIPANYC
jgi:2',3'-cyclic-nucleotide 2'-phosphodiesterase